MPEMSLVPDEARAMVGQQVGAAEGTACLKEAQRFAAAVGDLNPVYFDDAAARSAGYRGVVIPPLYIPYVTQGVIRRDTLRPDGIPGGRGSDLPLRVERRMAGGEAYEFLAPVYPGDTLRAETRIAEIEEKQGRSGAFVVVVRETTYTNQGGEIVARSRNTMIAR